MAPPNNRNQNRPRRCPPPLVRSHKTGRCVLPSRVMGRGPGGGSPFGGPATSPFGFGNPGPSPVIRPTPAPAPTCVTASIFSDCFGACSGVINGASPGPVCGWTYIEPFGPLGGQFTFTPGVMMMDTFDADDFPIASKPLPAPLASVFGVSGQFDFTEHQTPPNANTAYQALFTNAALTEGAFVGLFGDGGVVVQAGDSTTIPTYLGTWTPNGGAHVVHFSIDGAGVPVLYIDGVSIPLIFFGSVGSFLPLYPANSISYEGGSGDPTPDTSPLRSLFLTTGVVGPETEFCCPLAS